MTNNVYFIRTSVDDNEYYEKIKEIVEKTGFYEDLNPDNDVTINVHPRDVEKTQYINSTTIDKIMDCLSKYDVDSIITANDTLYHSMKNDDFEEILEKNNLKGICDDKVTIQKCDCEIFTDIPLLEDMVNNGHVIFFNQFKLHSMISFSGSLKSIATRSTNRKGQIMLHKLVKPFISKIACLACNVCADVCPQKAISVDSVANIKEELCTGCNVCVPSCPKDAIKLNKISSESFMKGLSEFSSVFLNYKKYNKVLFINSLINIKPYYDCNKNTDKVLADDIGLLASFDPVAVDRACYDLVNMTRDDKGTDIFKDIWRNVDGNCQFEYAEELGIGTTDYELVEL